MYRCKIKVIQEVHTDRSQRFYSLIRPINIIELAPTNIGTSLHTIISLSNGLLQYHYYWHIVHLWCRETTTQQQSNATENGTIIYEFAKTVLIQDTDRCGMY